MPRRHPPEHQGGVAVIGVVEYGARNGGNLVRALRRLGASLMSGSAS